MGPENLPTSEGERRDRSGWLGSGDSVTSVIRSTFQRICKTCLEILVFTRDSCFYQKECHVQEFCLCQIEADFMFFFKMIVFVYRIFFGWFLVFGDMYCNISTKKKVLFHSHF